MFSISRIRRGEYLHVVGVCGSYELLYGGFSVCYKLPAGMGWPLT